MINIRWLPVLAVIWILLVNGMYGCLSSPEDEDSGPFGEWVFLPEERILDIATVIYHPDVDVQEQLTILSITCTELGESASIHTDIPLAIDEGQLHPVTILFDDDEPIEEEWSYNQFDPSPDYYDASIDAVDASLFISRLLNAEKVSVHFAAKGGGTVAATWSDVRHFDEAYEALQQKCALASSAEEESSGPFGKWVFLSDQRTLDIGTVVHHPDVVAEEQLTILSITCTESAESASIHTDIPLAIDEGQLHPVTILFDDDEPIEEEWSYNRFDPSPDYYDASIDAVDSSFFISQLLNAEKVSVHFAANDGRIVTADWNDARHFDVAYEALQQECADAKTDADIGD